MKKLFFSALMCLCCSFVMGQTYYYKQTTKVEKGTGVKSKGSNQGYYITFQNNKRTCYFSNADGIATIENSGYESTFGISTGRRYEGMSLYTYLGERDGLHEYMKETTYYANIPANYSAGERGGYYPMSKNRTYLYFSPSYDRVNEWTDPKTYIVESSSNESQIVKAARAGTAMGANAGSDPNRPTYIFVYEQAAPEDPTGGPVILY